MDSRTAELIRKKLDYLERTLADWRLRRDGQAFLRAVTRYLASSGSKKSNHKR